jgi:protoheme IX farnesyltransferase
VNTSLITAIARPARISWIAKVIDYTELAKFRVVSLVLVTVGVSGFVAASGAPDPLAIVNTLIGTTLIAASGSVFNQLIERDRDAKMRRTVGRPLPSQRVPIGEAFGFGVVTFAGGTVYLWLTTNSITALLAAATWVMYVCLYTPLKPMTTWNTAVGAIPGALPVFFGWTGVGEPMRPSALLLFLLLFIWQFPHFMAIAWLYRNDYRNAGFRMVSGNDPRGRRTALVAVAGAAALFPVIWSMATWSDAPILIIVSTLLALGQLSGAVLFLKAPGDTSARALLRISLVYLPMQLGLIVAFQAGIN